MSSPERKLRRLTKQANGTTQASWMLERQVLCSAIAAMAKRRWRYKRIIEHLNEELERMGAGFGIGLREQ